MKKCLYILILFLFITSCGKKEIAALTALNDELNIKNEELISLVEKSEKAEKDTAAALKDCTQTVKSLKENLKVTMKETQKIAFIQKQLLGIKAKIVTSMGDMEVEFYPEVAPIHCFNFITRAESGYFNGTQFHRVIPGFMIQGGDPNSRDDDFSDDGRGGPIVSIPHEFNRREHVKGILSMARVSNPRMGAGTQFFIMHKRSPHLDNKYTVFGKVVKGLDIIDKIVSVQRDRMDHPLSAVRVLSVDIYK